MTSMTRFKHANYYLLRVQLMIMQLAEGLNNIKLAWLVTHASKYYMAAVASSGSRNCLINNMEQRLCEKNLAFN